MSFQLRRVQSVFEEELWCCSARPHPVGNQIPTPHAGSISNHNPTIILPRREYQPKKVETDWGEGISTMEFTSSKLDAAATDVPTDHLRCLALLQGCYWPGTYPYHPLVTRTLSTTMRASYLQHTPCFRPGHRDSREVRHSSTAQTPDCTSSQGRAP